MKEIKLIKVGEHYDLYHRIAEENLIIGFASTDNTFVNKLSLKNCQAIERSYDLDELADFYGAKAKGSVDFKLGANQGFEDGFQKAIELMGDKKFSEEDMVQLVKSSFYAGLSKGQGKNQDFNIDDYVKEHLQQTEWDVEIEMRSKNIDELRESNEGFLNNTNLYIPKLDADGCLILKRKI
jgi:hypothetical protein